MSITEKNDFDGYKFAVLCKYYLNLKDDYVVYKRTLQNTQAKTFYLNNKKLFDRLVEILNKHNIDCNNFLQFCINDCKANKFNIIEILSSPLTAKNYFDKQYKIQKNKKIYLLFLKSIKNIVKDCIKLGYHNASDYFRFLISNKRLASYFIAGKISIYYLAAIPNFKKVIEKLDDISKDAFIPLYDKIDIYHEDMNQATMYMKNIRLNPLKYTNEILLLIRSKYV